MSRWLFCTAVLMSASGLRPLAAQVVGGVTAGGTSSRLAGASVQDSEGRWSLTGGAYIDFYLFRALALGFEANYLELGARDATIGEAVGAELKLAYFEIPFVVKGVLPVGSLWQVRAHAGIGIQIKLSCGLKVGEAKADCTTDPPAGKVRGSVWAVPMGVGLSRRLGAVRASGDLRYSLGLSDVFSELDAKARAWQVLLHLEMPL